jgi:hypothetical protein
MQPNQERRSLLSVAHQFRPILDLISTIAVTVAAGAVVWTTLFSNGARGSAGANRPSPIETVTGLTLTLPPEKSSISALVRASRVHRLPVSLLRAICR